MIDKIDRLIINYLVRDGRMSGQKIAQELDLPERTVRNRIARLIADEIITVSAIINKRAIGYGVTADIFCQAEPGRVSEIASQITALPEVGYVATTLGEQDISLQVFCSSNKELFDFLEQKLAHIPGILRTRTAIVTEIVKSVWKWEIPIQTEEDKQPAP